MRDLVADISSYQKANDWFFYLLKKHGFKAVVIKLTQGSRSGDNYVNEYAQEQIRLARKHHLLVHAYHFAKFISPADAREEAKFFVSVANQYGISKKRVMAVDCEPNGPTGNVSAGTKAFNDYVHNHGWKRTAVYCPASWIWNGTIKPGKIGSTHLWIANYGVTQSNVAHTTMWQFTNKYNLQAWGIDANYDFTGYFSRKATSPRRVAHKAKKVVKKAVKKAIKQPALPYGVTKETGTFYPDQTLRIWNRPGLGATGYHFHKGEKVRYKGWTVNGDYVYLCYLAKGGKKWHYVACRERNTGKALGTFK